MDFSEGDLVRFLPEYALLDRGEYLIIEVHCDLGMVSLEIGDEFVLADVYMIEKVETK